MSKRPFRWIDHSTSSGSRRQRTRLESRKRAASWSRNSFLPCISLLRTALCNSRCTFKSHYDLERFGLARPFHGSWNSAADYLSGAFGVFISTCSCVIMLR